MGNAATDFTTLCASAIALTALAIHQIALLSARLEYCLCRPTTSEKERQNVR